MRTSLTLLLLLLVQQYHGYSYDQLPTLQRVRRVIGGYRSEVRQQPYMVNIRRRGSLQCGGSLLTSRCVITAAHCLNDGKIDDYVVRGGVTYLSDIRNARQVRKFLLPLGYDRVTLHHDVAILQLQQPLVGPNVGTISLGKKSPKVGSYIRVSGWGLTDQRSGHVPNHLHSVYVRVLERSECQKLYHGYRNITDAMYCASVPGLKDACNADSGGPAVDANDKLVGIVSWGKANRCAHKDSPGVYTNIAKLHAWIMDTKERYCSEEA